MKQVAEMPTEGQFVAVWTFDDKVWSDTYKWVDGEMHISDAFGDFYRDPHSVECNVDCFNTNNAVFFVI